jgi:hypothetical protein
VLELGVLRPAEQPQFASGSSAYASVGILHFNGDSGSELRESRRGYDPIAYDSVPYRSLSPMVSRCECSTDGEVNLGPPHFPQSPFVDNFRLARYTEQMVAMLLRRSGF